MSRRHVFAALAAVVLGGCVALGTARTGAGDDTGSIQVVPSISGGGLRTQALVTPYSSASVEHVVVKLLKLDGTTEVDLSGASRDVAKADLAGEVKFSGLRKNTKYRIRGYAYKASGTAEADLISVSDKSFVDVEVKTDDRPAIAKLNIGLMDTPFAAQGTSSIAFTDGGLTTKPEAMAFATPSPTPTPTPTPVPTPTPTPTEFLIVENLLLPYGVAIHGNTLYYADFSANKVYSATLAGEATATVDIAGKTGPRGLAVDSQGTLYVATGGGVVKVTQSTSSVFLKYPEIQSVLDVHVAPSDDLYVLDKRSNTTAVLKVTPSGATSSVAILPPASNWRDIAGPDSEGHLYVSNAVVSGVIWKVALADGATSSFVSGVYAPSGLHYDHSSGDLYFTTMSSGLYKAPPTGPHTTFKTGIFFASYGLARDASGSFYSSKNPGVGKGISKYTP